MPAISESYTRINVGRGVMIKIFLDHLYSSMCIVFVGLLLLNFIMGLIENSLFSEVMQFVIVWAPLSIAVASALTYKSAREGQQYS